MKWAIHAERLFDGTGNPVLHDALVIIENQHIIAVGPAAQGPLPADVPVLHVGDRTVLPGLIDAHVHMLFTGSALSGRNHAWLRTPRPC